jgi:hypothetical protein
METNQTQMPAPAMTQEQMIAEIHKFTKQTRNYMRWQMYITIILVVIPLLASLFILPFALSNLEKTYIAPLQGLQ